MTTLTTTLKTFLITLTLSMLLTACSSGGSRPGSNSAAAITIKGSVGDGPVTNSTITVKDAADATVSSSTSNNQANYQASFPADTLYPVLISSTGGLDAVTLTPPDFVMLSATLNSSETNANINPFSTLIVKTALAMPGGLTSSNLIAARAYIINKMNFGLDPRLIPDPIKTPTTDANVANMVKASETLAETIRRTRRTLLDVGIDLNEDQIIDFLAGDMSDGVIDGLGAGADIRIAATFNVITGQVLIEAVRNQLIVNGTLATTALDNAIQLTTPTATENTADVLIIPTMLTQAQTAIIAVQTLPLTTTEATELSNLASILSGIAPDSMASTIDALLPIAASGSFNQPITKLATATNSDLTAINTAVRDNSNNAPSITGTPSTMISENATYSFTPSASDPDGDSLTFIITNKPIWAFFDQSTGTLAGIPNNSHLGTTNGIIISVSDGTFTTPLAAFDITVTSTTAAIVMVSSNANLSNAIGLSGALLDGNVYIFFQEGSNWNTRGVNRVTFYCCKSGAEAHAVYPNVTTAPYMINVDLTQFATGTTRELYADVFFNDGSVDFFLVNFTIATLNPNNNAPSITGTPSTIIAEDTPYSFTPTANDIDGDTLTFNISNKPLWATFNTSTGTLTGTPDNNHVGTTNNIIISVNDRTDVTALPAFNITVTNVNDAPMITGTPTIIIAENKIYSFTPTASDIDGDTLTFNITNKPLWASFSTSTGALTGTPSSTDIGTSSGIIISVNDGITSASLASFDITVTKIVIGSAMVSWTPPLENNDGSALTDLAGYKIYYGTTAGKYTTTIDVNNTNITDYLIGNLTGPNTYYFVMTAYNSTGDESVYSNIASKIIQ